MELERKVSVEVLNEHGAFLRLSIVGARHADYPASRFFDDKHLNQAGTLALSASVAERLATRTPAQAEETRGALRDGPPPPPASFEHHVFSYCAGKKPRRVATARR